MIRDRLAALGRPLRAGLALAAGLLALASPAALHAQGTPAQWRYDIGSDGNAVAQYPGNVVVLGSITSAGGAPLTGSGTAGSITKWASISSITNAVSGTDYAPATTGSSLLYGNAAGGFSNATVGSGLLFSGGALSAVPEQAATFQNQQAASRTSAGNTSAGAVEAINVTTTAMTLNTTVFNNITGASLSSNQVTLPAGNYTFSANVPASSTGASVSVVRCSLFNVTDSTTLVTGSNSVLPGTGNTTAPFTAIAEGGFTLAGTKALSLRCIASVASGVGPNNQFLGSGNEVYESITFTKIG